MPKYELEIISHTGRQGRTWHWPVTNEEGGPPVEDGTHGYDTAAEAEPNA
jgi:hypothetical protein